MSPKFILIDIHDPQGFMAKHRLEETANDGNYKTGTPWYPYQYFFEMQYRLLIQSYQWANDVQNIKEMRE